jgi:hypothetical protein
MSVASVYVIAQIAAKERPPLSIPRRPSLMQYADFFRQAAQETASVVLYAGCRRAT